MLIRESQRSEFTLGRWL